MLIDITMKITPKIAENASGNTDRALIGHLGTHFDVMNKEFPLCYTRRDGVVFDVSRVGERDIDISDIDSSLLGEGMFAAFYTGYIERVEYGSREYFAGHPQLSEGLIDLLLDKGVSIIGLDFGGVRRGKEHTPKDQYCANRGTFVIENLCSLKSVADAGGRFIAHTYPMNYTSVTGLPCRVIAEV